MTYSKQIISGIYAEDTFLGSSKPRAVISQNLPFSKVHSKWIDPGFRAFCKNRPLGVSSANLDTLAFGDERLSRSLLFVPLHWEGKNIGLVSVQSYTPDKYSEIDIPKLQSYVDQIGGAVI